jgi:two-component system, LytTR family, sensor kinase
MEVRKATNWSWGMYLGIAFLIAAICHQFLEYQEAERQCSGCFYGRYDFFKDAFIPLCVLWLGGIICSYIWHYRVVPAILDGQLGLKHFFWLFWGGVFLVLGVLIHNYFSIKVVDENENFGTFNQFYAFSIFKNFATVFGLIIGYEIVNQIYYALLEQLKATNKIILKVSADFIGMNFIGLLAIYAWAPLHDILYNESNEFEGKWYSYLIIILTILHLYWFYRLIPLWRSKRYSLYALIFECTTYFFITLFMFVVLLEQVFFSSGLFLFVFLHLAGFFSGYLRWSLQSEKLQLQTQFSQTSAELSSLRAQINPHFLFNALNTLYAIAMKENSEKTADGIQKLGDMMRFMLQENHQTRIPLAKEIEYLQNFIDIQRMRLDENQEIDLKINLQQTDREVFIAPMLLNPLVENAFKHGISFRSASWIYITLTHDPSRIFFKVHNSYHPKADEDPEKDSHGIGLDNVKKRLELLYPGRHQFDVQASENDYFVSLILNITP